MRAAIVISGLDLHLVNLQKPTARPSRAFSLCLVFLFILAGITESVWGQAPPILWSTNVGAQLFAVDTQTNLYASSGGTVIKLNSDGMPLATNAICPLPGIAQRDGAGNYYFMGTFTGTQDFGGVTLVSGRDIFDETFVEGDFLAKYGSIGTLVWAKSFRAKPGYPSKADDLLVDPADGSCYAASTAPSENLGAIVYFDSTGSNLWMAELNHVWDGITLGALTSSNCAFDVFVEGRQLPGKVSKDGLLTGPGLPHAELGYRYSNPIYTWAKPVVDDLGRFVQAAKYLYGPPYPQYLVKYTNGTEIARVPLGAETLWTLTGDAQANVYLGGEFGSLKMHDRNGAFIWSTNLGTNAHRMIVDAGGNRFLSLADGSVARLAPDPVPEMPTAVLSPGSKTAFVGEEVTFTCISTGTLPLNFVWTHEGTNLSSPNTPALTFTNLGPSQAGLYRVIVTNIAGAVTSAPVLLRIKTVQLYLGNQLLTNGTYRFGTPPMLSIRNAFTNGASFYTLDGLTPSFASTPYTEPFPVPQAGTVRAIGYSADFFESEMADEVQISFVVSNRVLTFASTGGTVTLDPPGGYYSYSDVITVSALPSPGSEFLYWLGDAAGTNPVTELSLDQPRAVRAVFGTMLTTTIAGNGQLALDPPGGLYSYGTVVQVSALPQPGNYFGAWGNAATGNTNPLYFTISSPDPTVSSIFGPTPVGQSALTVQTRGNGRVTASPRANTYPTTQTVTLTALPEPGEHFLNWSGDASGTQNPFFIEMNSARTITAHFTSRPRLQVDQKGLEGLMATGFRLTLVSEPNSIWNILGSTNLTQWELLGNLTNVYGEVQFTDTNAPAFRSRVYRAGPE